MRRNGQTSIEYAVVIVFILGALLAMQFYGRRAIQGGLRQNFDRIGEQYDPTRTSGSVTASVDRETTTEIELHYPLTIGGRQGYGTRITEDIDQDDTTRTGDESVGAFASSIWE